MDTQDAPKPALPASLTAEAKRRRREAARNEPRTVQPLPAARLLTKHEVEAIANTSFPILWKWMRQGKFPRARIVGGRSMWLAGEIEGWLAALPLRPMRGDAVEEQKPAG